MKKTILFVVLLLATTLTFGQVYAPNGVLDATTNNSGVTSGNVGIGTTNPTARLEVVGVLKAEEGIFTNTYPDGTIFSSARDRNDKCIVLSAGSIIRAGVGYINTRMLNYFDFPQSNIDAKSSFHFGLEDRNDFGRFRLTAETGGITQMIMLNRFQQELMKVYEDGADNVFMHFPKPNSRIVIGGFGDYLPEHKFVVRGSAKIEGNVLTDANIGIGTSNFIDGGDTFRLSVKGKIRAEEIKVYSTWADYVFKKEYKLTTLNDVEKFIIQNGHLPNVPSAQEITQKGLELGEMSKIQQEKIEELTLYLIQQNKEIEELKSQMKAVLSKI